MKVLGQLTVAASTAFCVVLSEHKKSLWVLMLARRVDVVQHPLELTALHAVPCDLELGLCVDGSDLTSEVCRGLTQK
jgi:hypothetical protein